MLTEISQLSSPRLLPPLAEMSWEPSELSASPLPLYSPSLAQHLASVRTVVKSPLFPKAVICPYLTQSSCHCPYIGPQYVWSDPSYLSSLLYSAEPNLPPCCVSITSHLVLPQGHCTYQGSAWNPLCSTLHQTFFHGRKSFAPTPPVCPMFQSFILFSAVKFTFLFFFWASIHVFPS